MSLKFKMKAYWFRSGDRGTSVLEFPLWMEDGSQELLQTFLQIVLTEILKNYVWRCFDMRKWVLGFFLAYLLRSRLVCSLPPSTESKWLNLSGSAEAFSFSFFCVSDGLFAKTARQSRAKRWLRLRFNEGRQPLIKQDFCFCFSCFPSF